MHRILSLPHAPLLPPSCNYARHSLPLFCHPSLAGFSARPFTLPLHFVCLFPQPPHNRKQPHQIPIHPVTPSRSTPSLAYTSLVFSPPDPLKYRPASPPATPPQAIPSTAIVVAGTHPPHASTIDETGGRGVPTTPHRPRQIVPLRTLLSEFPSRLPPPHESPEPAHPHRLFHRLAIAPTATSVLLPSSSPGAKTHNKMALLPSAYLRHTTGITHTKHLLRIIPPLMLNPIPQTTTQHKYLYIVNIHLITL